MSASPAFLVISPSFRRSGFGGNSSQAIRKTHLYNNLMKIFQIISAYLLKDGGRSYRYYALIANYWVSQMSYKRILEKNIQYNVESGEPRNKKLVNKLIDDLDDVLETTIKYEYTRGIKCYTDILAKVMSERNDSREFCAEIAIYLEAGASDRRIFLLLSLGLSRNSAITVYRKIDADVNDVASCIEWLRANLPALRKELHELVIIEIENLVGAEAPKLNR